MVMHDMTCNHKQPTFQRRHYTMLAESIAKVMADYTTQPTAAALVRGLCDYLEDDNHLFDRGKFLAVSKVLDYPSNR